MSRRFPQESEPSSLTKMLESTGRTRGSSATPVDSGSPLASPQPQRDLQVKIERMNSDFRNTGLNQGITDQNNKTSSGRSSVLQNTANQGGHQHKLSMSARSVPSPDDQGVKISNFDRGSSAYQTRYNVNTGSSLNSFAAKQSASSNGTSRPATTDALTSQFLARLADVQQMVGRCKDLPRDLQKKLTEDLRKISQQFNEHHRTMAKEFDRCEKERDYLKRQLQLATEDNDRLMAENKKSAEKFEAAESRWNQIQADLIDQLRVQREQLTNKRALWMEANPGSSAKRDAMKEVLRDPFNSPSTSQTPSYTGGAMSSMNSPSILNSSSSVMGSPKMQYKNGGSSKVTSFGSATNAGSSTRGESRTRRNTGLPPAAQPRRGAMPCGVPVQSAYTKIPFPPVTDIYGSRQTFHTEPRTPPRSNALVVHKTDEELASDYKAAISKLYDLVENWVRKYSSAPNQNNDRAIASSNSVLWDYMMNCTYPGHRQDSHTHVVALLNNPDTRFWFVMRMATQYCVKDVMSINAFKPYSKRIEKTIDTLLLKLQERGLNNEARQRYIDELSEAIQCVTASKDYQDFRAKQLSIHTKALRDMLGPLLNDSVARASAGVDLGAIAILSWDLSCRMHTARLTFQIYFPETNGKFSAATMNPKDLTNVDPMQLQIEQIRLKLVITPVITMRDDRGTTIRAKAIHSANVLLMK